MTLNSTKINQLDQLSLQIRTLGSLELISDRFIGYYQAVLQQFSEDPFVPTLRRAYDQKTAPIVPIILQGQGLLARLAEAIAENSTPSAECAKLEMLYRPGTSLFYLAESLATEKPLDYKVAKRQVIDSRLRQADQKYDLWMKITIEEGDTPEIIAEKEERRATSTEDRAYQLRLIREQLEAIDARKLVLDEVLKAYVDASTQYSLILEESESSREEFTQRITAAYERSLRHDSLNEIIKRNKNTPPLNEMKN
ncbi:MAG: hypothetical protein V2A62_01535 [Candidatus Woesearchaeota archaeon]